MNRKDTPAEFVVKLIGQLAAYSLLSFVVAFLMEYMGQAGIR